MYFFPWKVILNHKILPNLHYISSANTQTLISEAGLQEG